MDTFNVPHPLQEHVLYTYMQGTCFNASYSANFMWYMVLIAHLIIA